MGQEAIATGCAIDLRPEDTIVPAPRDLIAGLVKVSLSAPSRRSFLCAARARIMPETRPRSGCRDGSALVNKRKNNRNVVVAFTSEPATSLGCWHEAVDFAATENLPIIFVVENNPWADPASFTTHGGGNDFTLQARDPA